MKRMLIKNLSTIKDSVVLEMIALYEAGREREEYRGLFKAQAKLLEVNVKVKESEIRNETVYLITDKE